MRAQRLESRMPKSDRAQLQWVREETATILLSFGVSPIVLLLYVAFSLGFVRDAVSNMLPLPRFEDPLSSTKFRVGDHCADGYGLVRRMWESRLTAN